MDSIGGKWIILVGNGLYWWKMNSTGDKWILLLGNEFNWW
jgi:hypothetical protein